MVTVWLLWFNRYCPKLQLWMLKAIQKDLTSISHHIIVIRKILYPFLHFRLLEAEINTICSPHTGESSIKCYWMNWKVWWGKWKKNSTFRVLAATLDLHFCFYHRGFPMDRKASTESSRLPTGRLELHTPVWMRRWFFRFPAVVNCLPQLDSGHIKGFSPLWVLMCTFSLCST